MRKELFEKIVNETEPQDELQLVLSTLSGHGGYSAGQTTLVVEAEYIKCFDTYARIQLIDEKVLHFGVGQTYAGMLYIEYEKIEMVIAI